MTFLMNAFLYLDKIIGTTALTKYYCQYRKDICLMRMINFTQTSTKQVEILFRLKCRNIDLKSTEKNDIFVCLIKVKNN
jgi:hypothetical protein